MSSNPLNQYPEASEMHDNLQNKSYCGMWFTLKRVCSLKDKQKTGEKKILTVDV